MKELLERKKGLRRKVLIVDDEAIEREMLGAMLSDLYETGYAGNGREALDTIRDESAAISLILLDLYMPKPDGYDLLKIIRGDPALRRIPVIVLTADATAH